MELLSLTKTQKGNRPFPFRFCPGEYFICPGNSWECVFLEFEKQELKKVLTK